jgi:biopolymer transport protein ExbD
MPKVKIKRGSTNVDMTAMCDVAFLLLTFFILVAKAKPNEPVVVITPSSISSTTLPDTSILMITIDSKNRVFFTIDSKTVNATGGKNSRAGLIDDMDQFKNLGLTDEEKKKFTQGASVGVPLNMIKSYLAQDGATQKEMDKTAPGIPIDTTAGTTANELNDWITVARNNNPYLRIVIKADGATSYPGYNKVLKTLSQMKINSFNLVTNLEAVPPGTAAYVNAQNASAAK